MRSPSHAGLTLVLATLVSLFVFFAYLATLRQKQVTFSVIVEHPPRTLPLRILADGREVQTLAALPLFAKTGLEQTSLEVKGRAQRRYGPEMLPSVAVQTLMPCGWKDLNVRVNEVPSVEDMEKTGQERGKATIRIAAFPGRKAQLLWIAVDNRGGPQHEVTVGSVTRAIPPDSAGVSIWPAPDCGEGVQVKLDGEGIGALTSWRELSPEEDSQQYVACANAPFGSSARAACFFTYLIDVSGKRCYRARRLTYGPPSAYLGGAESATIPAGRFHRLPGLDYFLESAPGAVNVPLAGVYTSRTEVTGTQCH